MLKKKTSPLGKLAALDDRLCDAVIGTMQKPLGGALYGLAYLLAAWMGFIAARKIGNLEWVESVLCAGVFVLWCLALFGRSRVRTLDALLMGAVLLMLFGARAAGMSVISPDCEAFLLPWAKTMADMRFTEIMQGRVGDYTVLYQYFVFLISRLSLDPVALYKLFSLSFEALLAYAAAGLACFSDGKGRESMRFRAVFFTVLVAPTVFLNSAIWAQCDAVFTSLALYGVLLILRDRPHAGCAALALSLCFKLQAVFILPVCALFFVWRKLSLRHALTALGTMGLVSVPALLAGKGVKGVLGVYLYQLGEYKQLVLGAPTIFQLLPGGVLISNQAASRIGILLAMCAMCAVLWLGVSGRRGSVTLALDVCFTLCIVIPFLLPHMHERYFFIADVLSIVYAAIHPRRAYAPAIVLLGSFNGYSLFLFSGTLLSWRVLTFAMLALCAVTTMLLARDARREAEE